MRARRADEGDPHARLSSVKYRGPGMQPLASHHGVKTHNMQQYSETNLQTRASSSGPVIQPSPPRPLHKMVNVLHFASSNLKCLATPPPTAHPIPTFGSLHSTHDVEPVPVGGEAVVHPRRRDRADHGRGQVRPQPAGEIQGVQIAQPSPCQCARQAIRQGPIRIDALTRSHREQANRAGPTTGPGPSLGQRGDRAHALLGETSLIKRREGA
jgi:hypothetical protein